MRVVRPNKGMQQTKRAKENGSILNARPELTVEFKGR